MQLLEPVKPLHGLVVHQFGSLPEPQVNHPHPVPSIDWTLRESARSKIKVMVKRILNKYGYPPDLQDQPVRTVLAQAKLLCAEWVT